MNGQLNDYVIDKNRLVRFLSKYCLPDRNTNELRIYNEYNKRCSLLSESKEYLRDIINGNTTIPVVQICKNCSTDSNDRASLSPRELNKGVLITLINSGKFQLPETAETGGFNKNKYIGEILDDKFLLPDMTAKLTDLTYYDIVDFLFRGTINKIVNPRDRDRLWDVRSDDISFIDDIKDGTLKIRGLNCNDPIDTNFLKRLRLEDSSTSSDSDTSTTSDESSETGDDNRIVDVKDNNDEPATNSETDIEPNESDTDETSHPEPQPYIQSPTHLSHTPAMDTEKSVVDTDDTVNTPETRIEGDKELDVKPVSDPVPSLPQEQTEYRIGKIFDSVANRTKSTVSKFKDAITESAKQKMVISASYDLNSDTGFIIKSKYL